MSSGIQFLLMSRFGIGIDNRVLIINEKPVRLSHTCFLGEAHDSIEETET